MSFEPTISVSIMYAPWVDWRYENTERNKERLERDQFVEDVSLCPASEETTPWDTARNAWSKVLDIQDTTHHLLLQGDVELCPDFGEVVYNMLRVLPNREICLYGNRKDLVEAAQDGHRWFRYRGCYWGQGRVLPMFYVKDMLDFCEKYYDESSVHDDVRYHAWGQIGRDTDTWIPIPQVVEHLGDEDSAMGNNTPVDLTASLYVGDTDLEPSEIDWGKGISEAPRRGGRNALKLYEERLDLDRLIEDGYIRETSR